MDGTNIDDHFISGMNLLKRHKERKNRMKMIENVLKEQHGAGATSMEI